MAQQEVYSTKAVQKLLGISAASVKRYADAGKIKRVKGGGYGVKALYDKKSVDDYVAQEKQFVIVA